MKAIILFLLLTCSLQAQFVPFGAWKSGAVSDTLVPEASDSLVVALWADRITGKSNGDTLFAWRNSAGYPDRDVLQATDAKKPVFTDSAVNNLPAVTFDGTDDVMFSATLAYNQFSGPSNFTAYVVLRQRAAKARNIPFGVGFGNPPRIILSATYDNNLQFDLPNANADGRVSAAQPTAWDDRWHIVEVYRSGDTGQISTNDTIRATASNLTARLPLATTNAFIVANYGTGTNADAFSGDIAVIIICKTSLSATRRQYYINILKSKYNLP